jgi:hypothetical protein
MQDRPPEVAGCRAATRYRPGDPAKAAADRGGASPWTRGSPGGLEAGVGDHERIGDELAVGHLTTATHPEPGPLPRRRRPGCRRRGGLRARPGRGPDDPAGAAAAIAGVGVPWRSSTWPGPRRTAVGDGRQQIPPRGHLRPPPASPPGRRDRRAAVCQRPDTGVGAGPGSSMCWPAMSGGRAAARGDGQRLQAGDRIIAGSVVQASIEIPDQVVAGLGPLGPVSLSIQPEPRRGRLAR